MAWKRSLVRVQYGPPKKTSRIRRLANREVFFVSQTLYTYPFPLYTVLMIATSHVIIGGTVGVITGNPALGFAAGIVSHFLMDMVPHLDSPFPIHYQDDQYDQPIWDKKLLIFAWIDSVAAMILTIAIWYWKFDLIFFSPYAWGALGAYLPDLLDNTPLWSAKIHRLHFFKPFHSVHLAVHDFWRFRFPMPQNWLLGTVSQILFIVPCLWFLFR
jgi:hypothetical protein